MKVLKKDSSGSVLIDTGKGFSVWVDVYKENDEIQFQWNKYIFFENNSLDIKIRNFQNDENNIDICTSLAIEYLENNLKQK